MNRFRESRSSVFRVALWLLAIALSCDAVNLDDLFSLSVVLHDDIDTIASSLHAPERSHGFGVPMQDRVLVPQRLVRPIIDQDSPALAADAIEATFSFLALLTDASVSLPRQQFPEDLLHLRHHSLLI